MEGVTKDGTRVDVWKGEGAPELGKPADFGAHYRNSQWLKYLNNLRGTGSAAIGPTWDATSAGSGTIGIKERSRWTRFTSPTCEELTPPPGQPAEPVEGARKFSTTPVRADREKAIREYRRTLRSTVEGRVVTLLAVLAKACGIALVDGRPAGRLCVERNGRAPSSPRSCGRPSGSSIPGYVGLFLWAAIFGFGVLRLGV